MKGALFCLLLFTLPACSLIYAGKGESAGAGPANGTYERIVFESAKATAEERAACEAAGGEVVPSGKMQWENCVQTFGDAGNACSGDADCMGECRYTGDTEMAPGSAVAGTCQVTDARFGCNTVVENGKVAHTLCVD